MKKFLLHIIGLLLGMLLIMAALDFAYTEVYRSHVRTKFQYLRSMKGKQVDYVFLGSSRVENNINPMIIEEKTGKSCINFGFQASKLHDISTILQTLKSYDIKSEKIFIQIDYIFNLNKHSNMMRYELIPFIRDNEVTRKNFDYLENSNALYYVPFYRYCLDDYKIGFRELTMNLAGKKTNVTRYKGYFPLYGEAPEKATTALPDKIWKNNPAFDSIQAYCQKNRIEPVFFCAPLMKTTKNLHFVKQLKTKIPQLKDYSQLIQDHTLFQNANHLNHKGAAYFTNYLITDLDLK